MNYIDLEHYPRRSHFEYFRHLAYPYVGMTAQMDVTNLVRAAKEREGSTFLACLYAAAQAANSVPELRQRIVDERIAQFDHCDTAHTVALPDHTFCNCRTDCRRSFDEFLTYGRECQEQAKTCHGFVSTQDDETDLIFVSCVPWVAFTQVIQPVTIPADSNPRIVFGKYVRQDGKVMMSLAIEANHGLVDGYHIGLFYQAFEDIASAVR